MKIFIDTDTFADAPAVYADAEKTQALPRVLPLVQGFKGTLRVGFLGSRAPSKSARAIFAARPLGAKTDVVQSPAGVYDEATGVPAFLFDITADTTQLADALGDKESLAMRAGIVVEEEALCLPARVEWQLTFSVSATALGGEQPEPRPSAADELRSEIAAEAACRAAADEALAAEIAAEIAAEKACRAAADEALREALAAESACRESGQVRVDSKFSEVDAALAEKADAADAVLLAAADSAEKNAASKHGKAALLTVDGGAGGVYISGLAGATRADEKWIAKARHDGVRVFRAPGAAPENFGYYAGACFCAGDVIARAKDVACSRADVCRAMAEQRDALRSEIASEAACRAAANATLCARICAVEISAGGGISAACVDAKIAAEAACRAAADAEALDALDAESACRKSEILRLDSNFSELSDALGEKADAADAVLLAAADSAEKNAASKHGKAALITVDGGSGGVYIAGSANATRADEKWIAKARHDGVRVYRAPGAAPENFGYYPGSCFCAGDVIAREKNLNALHAAVCGSMAAQRDELRTEIAAETICRKAAYCGLQANIDALDASFGAALCAQRSELHEWADARFICRGGDIVVGPGARLEFADSACGTAAAMRFTDSPTGGVLSIGSASTDAAMTWMSGNYMSWFSPEFLRLYSGASVVSPTAKIEANPSGVILAAGAGDAAKIVVDAGKIQVTGAPLTLNVAPTAANHAATKGYVDAADAELLDALDAESACRKSEILRVDSKFNELTDALDAESVAREKAVGAEAACRVAADACLRKCIGGRDSAVRALCGTVSALRTCVNVISTNVGCVYPTIPKICSKLGLLSSCASRLDSRVAEIEAGGDVDAKIAAEKSCRVAADKKLCAMIGDICLVALGALDERVCALERSTEIDVLRNSINAVDNRVLVLEDELDALDARVEALEQGGGGGGGGDASLAGNNVWTGRNVFVSPSGDFVVGARRAGSEMLRVGASLLDRDDVPMSISRCFVTIGFEASLRVYDYQPIRCGGGVRFVQSQGGFANVHISNRNASSRGRVMIPNPALCRSQWDAVDDAARRDDADEVTSAVVLSNPKSLMIELVTQSEFDAVPAPFKTCHSLYFILCGDEPL